MKVSLSLSVVALVAGQTPLASLYGGVYGAPSVYGGFGGVYGGANNGFGALYGGFGNLGQNYPQAAPELTNVCRLQGENHVCCVPQNLGGCSRGGFPSPSFLNAVCCDAARECCPQSRFGARAVYTCCAEGEGCELDEDGVGTCTTASSDSITIDAEELDGAGRCPDGALPLRSAPGETFRCSLNVNVPGSNRCPGESTCVKDLQLNVNTGVCCPATECSSRTDCEWCTTGRAPEDPNAVTEAPTEAPTRAPTPVGFPFPPLPNLPGLPDFVIDPSSQACDWLSEGDLYNAAPRCVATCDNFPSRSCVRFGTPQACPTSDEGENGLVVNTGTCARRCGSIGNGRGNQINNNGNEFDANNPPADHVSIDCCGDFPGDYCCNAWGGLSDHCQAGRIPGGPICGIIVRGTAADPNVINGFGSFGGPGFGQFPVGGFGPFFNGFRPIFREGEATGEATDVAEDENRQFYLFPGNNFYRPRPIFPLYPSRPASVLPSATVCSCDDNCASYDDCCADYDDLCVDEEDPEEII